MSPDFTENKELYDTIAITTSNQETGIARKACIHLKYTKLPPDRYAVLVSNVAAPVYRDARERNESWPKNLQPVHNIL